MHYYAHHIGDYRSATMHLTNDEDLAYRRLLEMYYDTEQPIPLETQWVSRRLRLGSEPIQNVLNDFFIRTENGWINERCDKEISMYHAQSAKNRENGKKGGRPRKQGAETVLENFHQDEKPSGFPVGSQSQPTGKATNNQEPITNNQEPETKNQKKEKKEKTTQASPARFDPASMDLPDCIKPQAWQEWIAYRRNRKLSCIEQTMQKQIKSLEAWYNEGHDPNAIIDLSITNAWQGLFPPKQSQAMLPSANSTDANQRLAEEAARRFNLTR